MPDLDKILKEQLSLTNEDIDKYKKLAAKDKKNIFTTLSNHSSLDKLTLLKVFSEFYKIDYVEINKTNFQENVSNLIPKNTATKNNVFSFEKVGNNLLVATAEPDNLKVLDRIKFKTGLKPKPILALEESIKEVVKKAYKSIKIKNDPSFSKSSSTSSQLRADIGRSTEGGAIVTLVNDIIIQCIERKGSDIHVEPYENSLRVRLRIDGSLTEIVKPPIGMKSALISRIKIMSGLNIAETRLPQDGAINLNIKSRPIDFRVSTLPGVYGEKIVMRLLDKSNLQVNMKLLGFEDIQLEKFVKSIHYSNGIVLVTGPTGSGKTTTLYSALQDLNTVERNIMTAEDPVEYSLEGINQVQMRPDIGLDFSATLRSFLRQDPDTIMVGEIRDIETAEIAIKAALTGHLVLSTLHTNSASDTVSRLLNMGVAPFNLAGALKCVTAQRLVRKICNDCKKEIDSPDKEKLKNIGIPEKHIEKVKIFEGEGCSACGQSGYIGREAIHEVLFLDDEVKKIIVNFTSTIQLKKIAMKSGMQTLRQSALKKMIQGITTISEVVRVTDED